MITNLNSCVWALSGRVWLLSRDNDEIPVPRIPISGPKLKATGQTGAGQKSARQSRYLNLVGQQTPTFRDKNLAQVQDGPAVTGFYGTQIPFSPAVQKFNLTHFSDRVLYLKTPLSGLLRTLFYE